MDTNVTTEMAQEMVRAAGHVGLGVAILQDDGTGKILPVYVNQAAADIYNYTQDELMTKLPEDIVVPEELNKVIANYKARMKGKAAPKFYEVTAIKKDGTHVPILLTLANINYRGKPATFMTYRDISDIKNRDEQLRQSEERFRSIFENGPIGIMSVGAENNILSANKAMCKMLGFTEGELKKLTFADISYPTTLKKDLLNAQLLRAGKISIYKTEKRYIRKDKKVIWVNITVSNIRNKKGEFLYNLTMIEDINARKIIEEEKEKQQLIIAESKAQTEAILQNLNEAVIGINEKGEIILMNFKAEEMFFLNAKKLIGKNKYKTLSRMLPLQDQFGKAVPMEKRPLIYTLKTGLPVNTSDYTYLIKGKKIPVGIVSSPIRIGKKLIGAVFAARDITAEKELERAKSEFVSVASHQLRTPLGISKWYLEELKDDDLMNKDPVTAKQYLAIVDENNERLISLINDLLSVSRIEGGGIHDTPVNLDLFEITGAVSKRLQIIADKKNIRIELNNECGHAPMKLDKERMEEVLEVLISNSIKYTGQNGRVIVSISGEDNCIKFSIRDNGIGIVEEDKPKIFSKFFRSAEASKIDSEGTGLGLFVAKSYIEDWGGKIWFDSKDGRGTTFTFTLPIKNKKIP